MLNRRQFLSRASLLSVGTVVPQFLVNTARAAEPGKDRVLVVVELTGGNDGLNTVIPYADDAYQKARPTLRRTKDQVLKVDDHIGLHQSLFGLSQLLEKKELAIVQGVGYPNPDRSHFESMDIWQSAELGKQKSGSGWLARSVPGLAGKDGGIPAMQVGTERLPLALQGPAGGVVSVNDKARLQLTMNDTEKDRRPARKKLIEELANLPHGEKEAGNMLQFVQRRQVQTYANLEKLRELVTQQRFFFGDESSLQPKMNLISELIKKEFGTRIFYVALNGFDTHSNEAETHSKLMVDLGNGINFLFNQLQQAGQDKRVVVLTYSEFGRRVQENGSKGTDHGSGSCLFVAGPAVQGGPIGEHPSLTDLDSGDLKHHTDFRRVYATLLDQWLGVNSEGVLGSKFEHLNLLKKG